MPTTAFRFDGKNERAQAAAQRQAAAMIRDISATTQAAIRDVIVRSIRDGIPPYDAARLIEEMIGLDERRMGAVLSYRERLINEGLPFGTVNALVDKYAAKQLRDRAEAIARTEIMDSLNAGAMEGWRQAQADGLLSKGAVKEWLTTPDERLCPNCAPLDGVQVPLRETFKTSLGEVQRPPLHTRCRCAVAVTEPDR
jgi:hypothetical protein